MSTLLPSMTYGDDIKRVTRTAFGGYCHRENAGAHELWDMENLTAAHAPAIAARSPRYRVAEMENPQGVVAGDGLYYVRDGWLCSWRDGVETVINPTQRLDRTGEKQLVQMGSYLLVFPDKCYYQQESGEFGSLESSFTGAVIFQDGTYAGEYADANTIVLPAAGAHRFREGDAVTITGCTQLLAQNNATLIIRELSEDGRTLRFYENSFYRPNVGQNGYSQTVSGVTLSRSLPEMDFVCQCENRLWGCKGKDLYASKLGDPFNFFAYDDGISTGSYWVQTGSAGAFTGCCSFLGYPVFFKEDQIYKVHGSKPSNFQVMGSASLGVTKGSGHSVAIAGERLFYLSRAGVTAYAGGMPTPVSSAFGTQQFQAAVAGTDGISYYVSMKQDGETPLFVYHTGQGMWHKEQAGSPVGFAFWDGGLYFLERNGTAGTLWLIGTPQRVPQGVLPETVVKSMAEFPDTAAGAAVGTGVVRLRLRMELASGSRVQVQISYDGGRYETVSVCQAAQKKSVMVPLVPRRCDHYRIRLNGLGGWKLLSSTCERYESPELC